MDSSYVVVVEEDGSKKPLRHAIKSGLAVSNLHSTLIQVEGASANGGNWLGLFCNDGRSPRMLAMD